MLKKITWMHGVIIALGSFMLFILSMIFIFTRGWQNAELVSENYYEEELSYQNVIDAKKNAEILKEKPKYIQSTQGIKISFPKERNIDSRKVNIHLFRTNDAKLDVKKELTTDDNGNIQIPKQVLVPGSYTLKIYWKENNQPYQIDYNLIWK